MKSSTHYLPDVSRIPFSAVQKAIITAQLTSLTSCRSPLNYYQSRAARFQRKIPVPNNSPTRCGSRSDLNSPTLLNSLKHDIVESNSRPPRTPWNSPTPVTLKTYSATLLSPVNNPTIALYGCTQVMRHHTSPDSTKMNFYQNNFQRTNEKTNDDSIAVRSFAIGAVCRSTVFTVAEKVVEEKMTGQYGHSTTTPYDSPFVRSHSTDTLLDSLTEVLGASVSSDDAIQEELGESRFEISAAVEADIVTDAEREVLKEDERATGEAFVCAVGVRSCKACAESDKIKMIAQYMHSPATPYGSPFDVRYVRSLFDDVEEFDIVSSPLKCCEESLGEAF